MEQEREKQALSEEIAQRFKKEIERTQLSNCELACQIGEPHPQRIRDVLRGKQRLPADMLSRAATIGIDVMYVVSGERTPMQISTTERALLENYRSTAKHERTHLVTP